MKKYFIGILACLLWAGVSLAQSGDTTTAPAAKNEWIAGASYNTALNYYGRVDSLHSRGFYPFLGVNFKNGLYFMADFIFVNNALTTAYAATIVQGGYRYTNKKKTWTVGLSGAGFLYRDNSTLVQSAVKGQAGIGISNTNKILNTSFGGDIKFSDEADFEAFAGLDHVFRFENIGKGVIVVDPSVYAYAGTQNFSKTYLQQKRFLIFPAGQQAITETSRQFNLLSYEISCPLIYGLGKMNLVLTPAYVLPRNILTGSDGSTAGEEAKNLFYTTATIRFSF